LILAQKLKLMLDILSADGHIEYEARLKKILNKEDAISKIKEIVRADFIKPG